MHYLDELNEEQKKAVLYTEGPLLVIAGAGTGKTKMLTHRILHLIHTGVTAHKILAITFTNKAAQEMRDRVALLLGNDDEIPFMSTFHSLGLRILREYHHLLGINKYFNILDSQDSRTLIKQVMRENNIDPKEWDPRKITSIISRAKMSEETAESFEVNNNPVSSITKIIWQGYEIIKKREHSLDFDDLLSQAYFLLKEYKEVQNYYQKKWQYLLVDEYQDTNTLQYKMVKILSENHRNICAVGDGDQNIYSWRGADMRNILNFEKDFGGTHPPVKIITLNQNYRSTQRILGGAHAIISKNSERYEKELITENTEGEKILITPSINELQEARSIVQRVETFIKENYEPKDIAVLFRTNFQSRVLEEAFLSYEIPYQVVGIKFFDHKEVKDVMSYLKASFNRDSLADIKRIINEPKRGLGKVAVAKIFSGKEHELTGGAQNSYKKFQILLDDIYSFAQEHPPHETLRFIIKQSGLEEKMKEGDTNEQERFENMKELVSYAIKFTEEENSYEQLFEHIALLSDQDTLLSRTKEEKNTVKLMTVHASKGLEFEIVFIAGLEQGLFPGQRDDSQSKYEKEEERRLCYVAFTRAKQKLILSYAHLRTIYGQQRINEPSEFIKDIPEELIDYDDDPFNEDEESSTFYLDF